MTETEIPALLQEALSRLEDCCEQLAATRTHEIYVAMIDGGQAQALLDLDNARQNARALLAERRRHTVEAQPTSFVLTQEFCESVKRLANAHPWTMDDILCVWHAMNSVARFPTPPSRAEVTPEWQPIETAPKDGTEIIGRCGPEYGCFSCSWDGQAFAHYDPDDGKIYYPVKEWVPFPAGPALGAGKEGE